MQSPGRARPAGRAAARAPETILLNNAPPRSRPRPFPHRIGPPGYLVTSRGTTSFASLHLPTTPIAAPATHPVPARFQTASPPCPGRSRPRLLAGNPRKLGYFPLSMLRRPAAKKPLRGSRRSVAARLRWRSSQRTSPCKKMQRIGPRCNGVPSARFVARLGGVGGSATQKRVATALRQRSALGFGDCKTGRINR